MAPSLKEALDKYLQSHKGIDLASYVMDHREATPPKSWSRIRELILEDTDGIFDVAGETLRTWAMDWAETAA